MEERYQMVEIKEDDNHEFTRDDYTRAASFWIS